MPQSLASDSMHPSGKLPPTLTPTGQFAGKPTLPISRSVTLIGSRKQARLQLISSSVSQNHALIVNADNGPYVRDLASRSHVFVNGTQVKEGDLKNGDEIQIGRFTFRFNESPNAAVATNRQAGPASPGHMVVDGADIPVPIDGKSVLIGRRETCDIHLLEDSVSTTHAIVFEMDGRRYIRDLASRTGTFVNGKQVHQVELMPGDEIRIGETSMRYAAEESPGVTAEEEMAPVELGATADDLVDLEAEVAPRRPAAPIEPTAAPAGTEALEMVQEQAEASEPVDLLPVELEAATAEAPEVPESPAAEVPETVGAEDLELEPLEVEAEEEAEPATAGFAAEPIAPAESPVEEWEAEEQGLRSAAEAPAAGQFDIQDDTEEPVDEDLVLTHLSPPMAPLPPLREEPAVVEPEPVAEAPAPEEEPEVELEPIEVEAEQPTPPADVNRAAPELELVPSAGETPTDQIDLDTDEDVSGPGETTGLAVAEPDERPTPIVSEQIVDEEPVEVEPEVDAVEAEVEVEPVAEAAEDELAKRQAAAGAPGGIRVEEPQHAEAEATEEAVEPEATEEEEFEEEEPEEELVAAAPAESAPVAPALSPEAFKLPEEPAASFEAEPEEVAADLNFAEAGIEAEDAADAAEPEVAIEPEIPPLPEFKESELDEIDFTADEKESSEAAFAPIDESEFELPPLDLGAAVEEELKFEPSLADTLDLGLEKIPGLPEPGDTIVGEQTPVLDMAGAEAPAVRPKKRLVRKKKLEPALPAAAPLAEAPPVIEPSPAAFEPIAPPAPAEAPTIQPTPAVSTPVEEAPGAEVPAEPVAEVPTLVEPAAPERAAFEPPEPSPFAEVRVPEEPLEPVAETGDVEVLEPTEATPTSAFDLESLAPPAQETIEAPPLTDTGFGRAVDEFTGVSTGPLIEQPAKEEPEAVEVEPVEVEPVEVEPELVAEDAPSAGAAHEEPVEISDDAAMSLLSEAPSEEPLAIPVEDETVETDARAPLLEPIETTAVPRAEDEEKIFDLEPMPVEDAQEAPEPVIETPEPVAEAPIEVEAELEPVEVEPEAVEVEPVEVEEEPAMPQAAAEPTDDWGLDWDESAAKKPAAPAPAPVAQMPPVPTSRFGPGASQLDLEPLSESELSAHPAEAEAQPVAEAPPHAAPVQPPSTPAQPPAARPPRPVAEAFNWGANQEHFLGGLPLQLTPPPAPRAPAQPPRAPAAPQPVAETPSPQVRPPVEPPRPQIQPTVEAPRPQPMPSAPMAPAARKPAAPQPKPTPPGKAKAPVATGFDGLAMPVAGQTDVFSQAPGSLTAGFAPGLMDDVFGARRPGAPPPAAPAGANNVSTPPRPRRATKAEPMGDAWAPAQVPAELDAPRRVQSPVPSEPAGSAPPPPRKKRRWFGLKVLIPVGILLAAAAAGAVYSIIPPRASIVGSLKFNNLGALPEFQRNALQEVQRKMLDRARTSARETLKAKGRDPGFLDDPEAVTKVIASGEFDKSRTAFTLNYEGRTLNPLKIKFAATDEDRIRMLALLDALYGANSAQVADWTKAYNAVASLTSQRAEDEKNVAELQRKLDDLTAAAQARPDAAERARLESEAGRLESDYNTAVANVTKLSNELKQLRENGNVAATEPAAPAPDAQLAQLQTDLKQLNDQVSAIQEGRSDKAKDARSQLDKALDGFNKQIEQAQGAVKNNPELLAYITTAQKVLSQTRELTDELIKSQQEQYNRLADLKAQLNEKMLARRAEVWKKDPELVKLMDQKEIKTRQYNAAVGQGLAREAEEIKTDLAFLDSAIKARQTIVADDGFYADAIDQLQKFIDTTQKSMEQDRTRTMAKLDEMQASFTQSQPAVEKLTPEQQQLAQEMGKRLADVRDARRQYTETADAANKQADEEIKNLQTSASQLATKVAERKRQIAEAGGAKLVQVPIPPPPQDKNKQIEQKGIELASAEKDRAAAEAAFQGANKKLLDLKNTMEQARKAGESRDGLLAQLDIAGKQLNQDTVSLEAKKKEMGLVPYPSKPTERDVLLNGDPQDPRPVYALASAGGIAVLCAFCWFLGNTGSREEDEVEEYFSDAYEPEATEEPVEPTESDRTSTTTAQTVEA